MTIVTEGLPETQFPADPENIEEYLIPPKTDVPNVISLEEGAAVRSLRDAKLNVSVQETPSLEPEGVVVRQSIQGGATVDQGTSVTIWVSNGEVPIGRLPRFTDMTFEEAVELAEEFSLETNVQLTLVQQDFELTDPSRVGIIVRTNPTPGTEITESATVVVFVGVLTQGNGNGNGNGNGGGGG
jgi:serine/threonine-protein kinase